MQNNPLIRIALAFSLCCGTSAQLWAADAPVAVVQNANLLEPRLNYRSLDQDVRDAELVTKNLGDPVQDYPRLVEFYNFLIQASPESYKADEVMSNGTQLIQRVFQMRLRLRSYVGELDVNSQQNPQIIKAIKDIMRAARYFEDMIGEQMSGLKALQKGEHARAAFSGRAPVVLSNPAITTTFDAEQLQSGDILLTRGSAANSAAIARIASDNSQFSHQALVYVDAKTGKKFIVHSLIEKGAIVEPLENILDHGVGRMVAYRYKDTAVAARAAQIMHDKVLSAQLSGHPIQYDFTMDLNQTEKLFCSQLVRLAFLEATQGSLDIPLIRSRFVQQNRSFLERLNISPDTKETYAPADIDLDPRFDLVSEFRDFRITKSLRNADFVMDKIFQWMENEDLEFTRKLWMTLMAQTGHKLSYVDFIKKFTWKIGMPVAPHVTPDLITLVISLEVTKRGLMQAIDPFVSAYETRFGRPAPPKLIYHWLEEQKIIKPDVIDLLKIRKTVTGAGLKSEKKSVLSAQTELRTQYFCSKVLG